MEFQFFINLMAPDEELDAVGECYAIFMRELTLDFLPQIGSTILLHTNLNSEDERAILYTGLLHKVDNFTFTFEIDNVFFDVDQNGNCTGIRLNTKYIFESSIEKFQIIERLLKEFYNFERII